MVLSTVPAAPGSSSGMCASSIGSAMSLSSPVCPTEAAAPMLSQATTHAHTHQRKDAAQTRGRGTTWGRERGGEGSVHHVIACITAPKVAHDITPPRQTVPSASRIDRCTLERWRRMISTCPIDYIPLSVSAFIGWPSFWRLRNGRERTSTAASQKREASGRFPLPLVYTK